MEDAGNELSEVTHHATLGASGAHRWLECPGSIRLAVGEPNNSSIYALEGTAAHEAAEWALRNRHRNIWEIRGTMWAVKDETGKVHRFEVDDGMCAAIEEYVNVITDLESRGKSETSIEVKFSLKDTIGRADMFGTSDCVVWVQDGPDPCLYVIDYKHGAGLPVEPEENSQLMFYALGAGGSLMSKVELIVVQPRADHSQGTTRRWRTTGKHIAEWAKGVLKPGAEATEKPDAPLNPGDWCKFCTGKSKCPALTAEVSEKAKLVFDPVETVRFTPPSPRDMSAADIGAILDAKSLINGWVSALEAEALDRLNAAKVVPGYKLVKKRSNRAWEDVAEAVEMIDMYGIDRSNLFTEPKLKSPAVVEKIIGKKDFAAMGLTTKADKGYSLGQTKDDRQAEAPKALTVFDAASPQPAAPPDDFLAF
jgi:hypothetical protein